MRVLKCEQARQYDEGQSCLGGVQREVSESCRHYNGHAVLGKGVRMFGGLL